MPCLVIGLPGFFHVFLHCTSSTGCLWLLVSKSVFWCRCSSCQKNTLHFLFQPHTPAHSLHSVTARCGIIALNCSTCPQRSLPLMNYILITQVLPLPVLENVSGHLLKFDQKWWFTKSAFIQEAFKSPISWSETNQRRSAHLWKPLQGLKYSNIL